MTLLLRASKQQLAGYGVGQYECSFTTSDNEIVLVDTVFPCVHMKVTDNASNIKKAFKFFDDEATNRTYYLTQWLESGLFYL